MPDDLAVLRAGPRGLTADGDDDDAGAGIELAAHLLRLRVRPEQTGLLRGVLGTDERLAGLRNHGYQDTRRGGGVKSDGRSVVTTTNRSL